MAATLVQYLGTGRRKTSVARIFLRSGKGEITVNGRTFDNYFANQSSRAMVRQPLLATEMADKFDIIILANGGGPTGRREQHAWALLEPSSNSIPNCGQN